MPLTRIFDLEPSSMEIPLRPEYVEKIRRVEKEPRKKISVNKYFGLD